MLLKLERDALLDGYYQITPVAQVCGALGTKTL
jgi:hypothetical protein